MNRFKFCIWLLDRLSRRRMTLQQISDEWEHASANDKEAKLTPRTFLRLKNLAEELFNVNIECHKPTNEYFVDAESMEYIQKWMLSALRLQELSSISDLRQVIMLEPPPAGTEKVRQLAEACIERRLVKVVYKSPYKPEATFTLIPYFLRLFKQRWYLTSKFSNSDHFITMALERIREVELGERLSDKSPRPSSEEFFDGCYGVIVQGKPERIVIRAFWPENTYLKEVPLHPSQEVVADTENWTDFSLYVRLTYDFKQELFWHRDKLTVLAPQKLRDDMIDILERMLSSYKTGLPNCKDE